MVADVTGVDDRRLLQADILAADVEQVTLPASGRRPSGRKVAMFAAVAVAVALVSVPAFAGAGAVQASYLAGSALAVGGIWIGIRVRRPTTVRPWLWLAWGVTSWSAADFAYAAYGWLGRPDPTVSLADPLYLAGYVCVVMGVLGVIRARRPDGDFDALLDAAAVGVTALLLTWEFLVRPSLDAQSDFPTTFMLAIYPVADVVVLVLLVRLLLDTRLRSAATGLLCVSLTTWLLADAAYSVLAATGAYSFGGTAWLDELWLVGMLLMALAALHPRMASLTTDTPNPRQMRPYRLAVGVTCVTVPGATAALASIADHPVSAPAFLLATFALAALVLTRSIRLLRQKDAAEIAVRRSDHYHQALAENSADAVVVIDTGGVILGDAPTLADLLGYPNVAVRGASIFVLVDRVDRDTAGALLDRAVSRPGEVLTGELRVRHADGAERWFEARVVSLLEDPYVSGVIVNLHDVTVRKHMEEELNHQAFHDALTGLANRALFRNRVEHALRRTERTSDETAVLFVDLDGFKTINDSLGHDAGDALLEAIARRLEKVVRSGDTVARLGGDEFAVLIEPGRDTTTQATAVADRILTTLREPLDVGDVRMTIGASIGVAVGHVGAEELLRNADVAMYRAKATGKRQWVLYDDGMREAAVERLRLETDLRTALERDEFELHYQPIVELDSGRLTGFEALLRWNHPTLGQVVPDRFIPIAEDTGAIVSIGAWVMRTACLTARAWQDRRTSQPPLTMSVNFSTRQLASSGVVAMVRAALADSGVDPGSVILEMTESYLISEPASAAARLHELRDLGVRLAVDDFGTGYSSLGYLRQFPVDILKIDRSFVDSMSEDDEVPALIRAVLDLCRTLDLEAVAEGIEMPHQLEQLVSERCRLGQGFLFDRPLDLAAAQALVDADRAPVDARSPAATVTT